MLHNELDVISPNIRAQVIAAIPPEAWEKETPLGAWGAMGNARHGIGYPGYASMDYVPASRWINDLADRLSKPVFTVTLEEWVPHRAEIMAWLTEEYSRLGVGEPDPGLQFRNRWRQRNRRRSHWRSGAIAMSLTSTWDSSTITRNVAALIRKDFN